MARKRTGRQGRRRAPRAAVEPLPPEVQARFDRHLAILVGYVPLPEMTQDETDWLFEQKVRLAWDQQGR